MLESRRHGTLQTFLFVYIGRGGVCTVVPVPRQSFLFFRAHRIRKSLLSADWTEGNPPKITDVQLSLQYTTNGLFILPLGYIRDVCSFVPSSHCYACWGFIVGSRALIGFNCASYLPSARCSVRRCFFVTRLLPSGRASPVYAVIWTFFVIACTRTASLNDLV